jgi:hypothetical protein
MNRPRIACIGTRELTKEENALLVEIGAWLVRQGYIVSTGLAVGSDQAFGWGANSVDPTRLELWQPWPNYEKASIKPGNIVHPSPEPWMFEMTSKYHPNWEACSQGTRRLHARNVGIVVGVKSVVALPGRQRLGGTGQGMRIAASLGIPVLNLRIKYDLDKVLRKIRT